MPQERSSPEKPAVSSKKWVGIATRNDEIERLNRPLSRYKENSLDFPSSDGGFEDLLTRKFGDLTSIDRNSLEWIWSICMGIR